VVERIADVARAAMRPAPVVVGLLRDATRSREELVAVAFLNGLHHDYRRAALGHAATSAARRRSRSAARPARNRARSLMPVPVENGGLGQPILDAKALEHLEVR
jgi:hypothetical protein